MERETEEPAIPDSARPITVESAKGNAVRARLVQIEHEAQPGTRSNNAVHVELFDRLRIGRLERTESDMPLDGDGEKETVDEGRFLCGRSGKGIKVFHADGPDTWPTCKRCQTVAKNLKEKGLSIYLLPRDVWMHCQDANVSMQTLDMLEAL